MHIRLVYVYVVKVYVVGSKSGQCKNCVEGKNELAYIGVAAASIDDLTDSKLPTLITGSQYFVDINAYFRNMSAATRVKLMLFESQTVVFC